MGDAAFRFATVDDHEIVEAIADATDIASGRDLRAYLAMATFENHHIVISAQVGAADADRWVPEFQSAVRPIRWRPISSEAP